MRVVMFTFYAFSWNGALHISSKLDIPAKVLKCALNRNIPCSARHLPSRAGRNCDEVKRSVTDGTTLRPSNFYHVSICEHRGLYVC